jgi:hypothetical protein
MQTVMPIVKPRILMKENILLFIKFRHAVLK